MQNKSACQYGGRVLFLSLAVVRDKPVFEVCFWSHLNNTILGRSCPLFLGKEKLRHILGQPSRSDFVQFIFDEDEETIVSKDIDAEHARIIRLKVARALILRSAVLIFGSDNYKNIESVKITGFLEYYDTVFGNWECIDVMKVNISREYYNKINLERASLSELFERKLKVIESKGLYMKKPYELKEVSNT